MLKRILNNMVLHRDDVVIMDDRPGTHGAGTLPKGWISYRCREPGARNIQTYKNVKRLAKDLGVSRCVWLPMSSGRRGRGIYQEQDRLAKFTWLYSLQSKVIDADRRVNPPMMSAKQQQKEIIKIQDRIDPGSMI